MIFKNLTRMKKNVSKRAELSFAIFVELKLITSRHTMMKSYRFREQKFSSLAGLEALKLKKPMT